MHLLDGSRRDLSGLSGFGAHEDTVEKICYRAWVTASKHIIIKT